MHEAVPQAEAITDALRSAGAIFAFAFGSRARGEARSDSDTDIAAFFGGAAPQSFEVLLPPGVDLLVLDGAPLELAGRVATEGVVVFDDAPQQRIEWLAQTRKIYADERYRFERSHREFAQEASSRG